MNKVIPVLHLHGDTKNGNIWYFIKLCNVFINVPNIILFNISDVLTNFNISDVLTNISDVLTNDDTVN